MTQVTIEGKHRDEPIKAEVTVAELPQSVAISSMIANGQLQTSVNGVNIQNGLATQINAKAATGEDAAVRERAATARRDLRRAFGRAG